MNKSNSGESATIEFQPILKRFKMWHKIEKDWYCPTEGGDGIFDITNIPNLKMAMQVYFANPNDWVVIQSTNLFDKDGKEIFEGSILEQTLLERPPHGKYSVKYVCKSQVVYDDGEYRTEHYESDGKFSGSSPLSESFGVWTGYNDNKSKEELKVIGHILSNPELLEER